MHTNANNSGVIGKRNPPKATKRPIAMAVSEDPRIPSGFKIPIDLKLKHFLFLENLVMFAIELLVKLKGYDFRPALEVIYLPSRKRRYTRRQIMAEIP